MLICSGGNYDRLCAKYGFEKPNDARALELMNAAAKSTMEGIPEVGIGYGVSDEIRYLYRPLFLVVSGGGRERDAPQGNRFFFPIQADKSACCVAVLCLDDPVSFLSGEKGDLIFSPTPTVLPFCRFMNRTSRSCFYVGIFHFFSLFFSN